MPKSPATTGLTGRRIDIAAGPSHGRSRDRGRGTVARSGRIARVAIETSAETREAAAVLAANAPRSSPEPESGTLHGALNWTLDETEKSGAQHGIENGIENKIENGTRYGTENGTQHETKNGTQLGTERERENGTENGTKSRTRYGPGNGTQHGSENKTENGSRLGTEDEARHETGNGTENGTGGRTQTGHAAAETTRKGVDRRSDGHDDRVHTLSNYSCNHPVTNSNAVDSEIRSSVSNPIWGMENNATKTPPKCTKQSKKSKNPKGRRLQHEVTRSRPAAPAPSARAGPG